MAKYTCGPPNPRTIEDGHLFVITTRLLMARFSMS